MIDPTSNLERRYKISCMSRDVAGEGEARFRSRSVTIPTSFSSSSTGIMLMWLSIETFIACRNVSVTLRLMTSLLIQSFVNMLSPA